jgi:hypothetical protein
MRKSTDFVLRSIAFGLTATSASATTSTTAFATTSTTATAAGSALAFASGFAVRASFAALIRLNTHVGHVARQASPSRTSSESPPDSFADTTAKRCRLDDLAIKLIADFARPDWAPASFHS